MDGAMIMLNMRDLILMFMHSDTIMKETWIGVSILKPH